MKEWRDCNAIYQVYPRSFKDTNGDGVGDINGVIEKLDYLKGSLGSLGVDALWLSPFYPSPMADFGYDVSDYRDVHPMFGSLDDFKRLLDEAHERDIRVMIDYVPNHTSIEHDWFKASRESRENAFRDFYVWRDPKVDGAPPNNWLSVFGGPAWTFDEQTGQYYLHSFLKEQPDLNWHNPHVRWEMQQVLRYWLDMGVDGIRADAVRWIAKDPDLRDEPLNPDYETGKDPYHERLHTHSKYGLELFQYLREMTDVIEEYDNRIMIFEDYPDPLYSTREQYLGFYSVDPKVSLPFNFEGMDLPWSARAFAGFLEDFQGMLLPEHTPSYCFSNHDKPRLVSHFGGEAQARIIALLQLTLPGIPTIYYGDEIGMKNTDIPPDAVRDPWKIANGDAVTGRDQSRTPMQWNSREHAGFTDGEPWLPVHSEYQAINVESEIGHVGSFYELYRRLLRLRANSEGIRSGEFRTIDVGHKDVLVYERTSEKHKYYVALNFDVTHEAHIELPQEGETICGTNLSRFPRQSGNKKLMLEPLEGVVIRVKR